MNLFQAFSQAVAAAAPESEVRVYDRLKHLHVFDTSGVGFVQVETYTLPTGVMADVYLCRHGRQVKSFTLTPMKSQERLQEGARRVAQALTWVSA